jgi:chromosome segregation ATPase
LKEKAMNDYLLAADSFKRFAAQYGAMLKGFELLGSLGSLEEAIAQAQQQLKTLQEQVAALKQEAEVAERDSAAKREALTKLHAAIKSLPATDKRHTASK